MRLQQIKLAGFKSFAEPTTFQLPGQRVGVVGPNGCGKSNIIDAVRWVLGESKASELRGESMQDVIFNGSGQRKPAARASVELVFSNEDSRAGGAWARFAEIAVKRVLTREGASSYFINGQPVRRRDVQDVFLGTGLGPRAYAIIGQGTISRIIESRPEDLRLFLEEAAGVSKYKERRRDTENRLRDTRENLTRVDDIQRELGKQLEHLEAQAEVAQQYRGLQEAGTTKLHQLWFLKHRDASGESERVKRQNLEAVNALEARLADLRHVEAQLETLRQQHYTAGDALHIKQGELAQAAMQVSRLEERIRHVVDARQRAESRLAELNVQQQQWQARKASAEAELAGLGDAAAQAEERAEIAAAQLDEQQAQLPALDDAWRAAKTRADAQRAQVASVQQQLQVLAAEGRAVDEQRRQLEQRRERLEAQRRSLAPSDDAALLKLRSDADAAQAALTAADERAQALAEQAAQLDEDRRAKAEHSASEASRLTERQARLDALQALQDKLHSDGKLTPWLARHGLDSLQGLWEKLHIETGWEAALESALREQLSAREVGRLDSLLAFEHDAPPSRLAFYALASDGAPAAEAPSPGHLPTLAARLRCSDARLQALVAHWLHGVYTAESLADAMAARAHLSAGQIIVTREGHCVSTQAVSFYAPDSEQAGMLARAQEIEQLTLACRAQQLMADEAKSQWVRAEADFAELQQQAAQSRRELGALQQQAQALQVRRAQADQQALAAAAQATQLQEDTADLNAQEEALAERRAEQEARLETLDADLGNAQEQHASLEDEGIGAERALAQAREQLRALEAAAREAEFELRAQGARRGELERTLQTADEQLAAQAQAGQQLQLDLGALDDAAAEEGLQEALAARSLAEGVLAEERRGYDELTAQLRAADEARLTHERALEPLRERITQLQLAEQAASLGGAQYLEQLQAAEVDLEALAQGIEAGGVKLTGLQSEIDRINREIAALGAVNLAALDELGASRERKQFLDAQSADLMDAMQTLEDAIKKIDSETRDLLAATFAQVNEGFGRMFPTLFGGGQAKLVMTGEEILESGVQVMAQPPGKKNATIHLLSGGEKALTAIALVFAIFSLNPAPFCLLDEVDAPLDDANTERYARLVKQMSEVTQFLFISHNKIAMEMAEQLIGVTMQEQGVSRIVAVDMQAAALMVEA